MRHFALTSLVMILATVVGIPQRTLGDELDNHPALRLFPSPEEWRQRITSAKHDDPNGFAAARLDFDSAIRSSALLYEETPGVASVLAARRSVVRPIVSTSRVRVPEDIDWAIEEARGKNGENDIERWYRAHADELCVADTPMLRLVLADTMLNEWTDWTAWENQPKLEALRVECPWVHRYHALALAAKLSTVDYNGMLLRWAVTQDTRSDVDWVIISLLIGGSHNVDVLDYLLQAASRQIPASTRRVLLSAAVQTDSDNESTFPLFRDLWARYLTADDNQIRGEAVLRVGEMVSRIRIHSKGRDNSEELQTRLQRIGETDSDQEVRSRAKHALDSIRTAEWRDDP